MAGIEWSQDGFQKRFRGLVRVAVDRLLHLAVAQARRAAHQATHELVAPLVALGIEPQMHGHAGAVLALDQRAELGRSDEHTSELQSLMRISYAGFCLKKKNQLT